MTTTCPQNHQIRSSADRDRQGYCRECRREGDRARRLQRQAAHEVVKVFEAAGVKFQNDGIPLNASEVAEALIRIYGR
ncbi:hypothetical protein QM806_36550 [Rhodococcus sp. IEGM 1351]|nr:hypothetical protein [Rhodococcus sp. IEGM 1351]